jgi:hypothetical protein
MGYKVGDKIKVYATRVPVYADDYYTPSYQETTKILTVVMVFGDNKYAVRFGKTSARLNIINTDFGTLSTKKAKWEIEPVFNYDKKDNS